MPFFEQPLPARFFMRRVDRKEQGAVGLCRLLIARRVADHQRVVRRIFLGFAEQSLSSCRFPGRRWRRRYFARSCSSHSRSSASSGVAETTNRSACGCKLLQAFADGGKRRHSAHECARPLRSPPSTRPAPAPARRRRLLRGRLQRRIGQLGFALDPIATSDCGMRISTPRACTSARSRTISSASIKAGKRLIPRLLEYRLTNSAASRTYLLMPAGCSDGRCSE